jgi:hypothetical protein
MKKKRILLLSCMALFGLCALAVFFACENPTEDVISKAKGGFNNEEDPWENEEGNTGGGAGTGENFEWAVQDDPPGAAFTAGTNSGVWADRAYLGIGQMTETLTAAPDNAGIVTAQIENKKLVLTAVAPGTTYVRVRDTKSNEAVVPVMVKRGGEVLTGAVGKYYTAASSSHKRGAPGDDRWTVTQKIINGTDGKAPALPTPAALNATGHKNWYPDPFTFLDGGKVANAADWEARREELDAIMQYYWGGMHPSIAPDVVSIEFTAQGSYGARIVVTHLASNRDLTLTVSPSVSNSPAPNSRALMLGVGETYTNVNGGNASALDIANIITASETARTSSVATLYGLTASDPDTPSAHMAYAWGASVIMTVIERGGFGGVFDPNKVYTGGGSRYGKASEVVMCFAESVGGHRLAGGLINSAGAGGPSIERYVAATGYKDGAEDPLPPWDTTGSVSVSDADFMSHAWNIKTGITWGDGSTASTSASTYRAWAPYNETYATTKAQGASAPPGTAGRTDRLFGSKQLSYTEAWSGIQTWPECYQEDMGWFGARLNQFTHNHADFNLDRVTSQPNRTKWGIFNTTNFDSYFMSMLRAPYTIYFADGYRVPRNNVESQFANWVICDEVYQLYYEDPKSIDYQDDTVIWRNGMTMTDVTHLANASRDRTSFQAFMDAYFEHKTGPNKYPAYGEMFRTPVFQIDDPVSRWEYYKMNWGRPNHPSIADRVRARIEPVFSDSDTGVYGTTGYIPGGHSIPSGSKYRAMDWRGLLDAPELL